MTRHFFNANPNFYLKINILLIIKYNVNNYLFNKNKFNYSDLLYIFVT